MPFNINQFHSQIAKTGGFALSCDFEVEMPSVVGVTRQTNLGISDAENLKFRISSIDMPSRGVIFSDYRDYGVPYKIATASNYLDTTLVVKLSPDYRERKYFLNWQDIIIGNHRSTNLSGDEQTTQWDIGYYEDYIANIRLKIFIGINKDESKLLYEIEFIDAYPINIGNITMNWDVTEVSQLPVTIGYRYFKDRFYDNEIFQAQRNISFFERLNQTGLGGLIGVGAGAAIGQSSAAAAATFLASRI